jgi:pimeloyl-ACP methyl ester carboxylesterase
MFRSLALSLILAVPQAAKSEDALPRRAWLGAALEEAEGGVRVREVMAGSSAEAAGLAAGDVIRALDGEAAGSLGDLVGRLRSRREGETVEAEVARDGEPRTTAIALKGWPREAGTEAYGVEYGEVPSVVGRLRTIAYVPKGEREERRPALLIVQGIGAATLDNPRPGEPVEAPTGMNVYRALADAAARAGFVALRVDKGGCGDSEGDAATLDFEQELDGYRAALAALRSRGDVDPERVFLFGHSMGGVFAPILAGETAVRGVIVYGTLVKTWAEYVAENSRRQAMLAGADPVAFDREARLMMRFHHALLVERKPIAEILAEIPEIEAVRDDLWIDGDMMYGRHYSFFPQLADRNLAEAWTNAAPRTRVLALWGAAEFVTAREDHEWIADMVNRVAEGHGEFRVVEDSDHGFHRFATPADADAAARDRSIPMEFNPAILEVVTGWVREDGGQG